MCKQKVLDQLMNAMGSISEAFKHAKDLFSDSKPAAPIPPLSSPPGNSAATAGEKEFVETIVNMARGSDGKTST
jgi:hypothetical protein